MRQKDFWPENEEVKPLTIWAQWRLILCVNVTRPWGAQTFGQTLFWVCLWGCFWLRWVTFESGDWVKQTSLPSVGAGRGRRCSPIHCRPEENTKAVERSLCLTILELVFCPWTGLSTFGSPGPLLAKCRYWAYSGSSNHVGQFLIINLRQTDRQTHTHTHTCNSIHPLGSVSSGEPSL